MMKLLAPETFAECYPSRAPFGTPAPARRIPPSPASARLRDESGICQPRRFLQLPDYPITQLPPRSPAISRPRGEGGQIDRRAHPPEGHPWSRPEDGRIAVELRTDGVTRAHPRAALHATAATDCHSAPRRARARRRGKGGEFDWLAHPPEGPSGSHPGKEEVVAEFRTAAAARVPSPAATATTPAAAHHRPPPPASPRQRGEGGSLQLPNYPIAQLPNRLWLSLRLPSPSPLSSRGRVAPPGFHRD